MRIVVTTASAPARVFTPSDDWRKHTLPGGVSLNDVRALPVTDEEPFLLMPERMLKR
jgi:hypothetical protein